MTGDELSSLYPHLFREVTWPWGPTKARFLLLSETPPSDQIANVNIVPLCENSWVMLRLVDGSWEIPGGTLEPSETYIDAIRRELMEEAGTELISHQLLGAWFCRSLADKPYRPHLPHPDYYRLVLMGEIKFVESPVNPPGTEKIKLVDACPINTAVERFTSQGRQDLAELYLLASTIQPGWVGKMVGKAMR